MGYNEVRKEGYDVIQDRVVNLQTGIFIVSGLSIIIALANFSICLWIRFDLDFAEWVVEIGWYTYWNAMYVVMVAMLLHTLNSLLLYYATITESTSLLIVNMILRVLIWCVTLAGAIVICLYGVEESKMLTRELHEVFMNMIHKWDEDERASRAMKQIQEYIGCCGASGNRDDYIRVRKVVPPECRHPVTGNNYRFNCAQTVAWWLEPWTCTLAGLSLFFTASDFFVLYVTGRLRRYLNQLKE